MRNKTGSVCVHSLQKEKTQITHNCQNLNYFLLLHQGPHPPLTSLLQLRGTPTAGVGEGCGREGDGRCPRLVLAGEGRGRAGRLCFMPFPNSLRLLNGCSVTACIPPPETSPSSLGQGLDFTYLYFHEFIEHLFTVVTFKTLFVSCIPGNAIFFFSLTKGWGFF